MSIHSHSTIKPLYFEVISNCTGPQEFKFEFRGVSLYRQGGGVRISITLSEQTYQG